MSTPMSYIGPANPTSETIGSYIYAVGNPFLWWAATLAILYAVIDYLTEYVGSWRRRFSNPLSYFASMPRIRQAILVTALVPLAAYGGFFLLQRTTFIFYMTLVVPFFAVVLAGALTYMWSTGNRLVRAAFLLVCAAVAFGFLWYLQVSIYMPIPRNGFAWLPWPGTPFYYPAIGFNDVMRLLPWMQQYGNQACWKGDLGLDACP
jgi:dolichyl-phosphate-mannose--protein O-mannosyl transferase